MAYTLKKALMDGSIQEALQFTHFNDMDNIPIESISVQELPAGDFINEHELVLTTAIGCNTNPEGFTWLVEECIQAKAAAVVFCFCDSTFHVPAPVIHMADQAGLPLFQVPWKYRFSDIQEKILRGIRADKQSVYTSLQSLLFSLFLSGTPLDAAVQKIQDTLHIKIAIVDKYRYFIAGNSRYKEFLPGYQIPISVRKILSGTLYILSEAYYSDKENISLFTSNIIPPILLWFHQREIENYEKRQLRNRFVWELSHNKTENTESLMEQAAELNICLDLDYCCIASELIREPAPAHKGISYPYLPQAGFFVDLEQQIFFLLKQTHLHYMLARKNDFFIIYIETAPDIRNTIQSLLKKINNLLRPQIPGYEFCHGVYLYDADKKADYPLCYKRAKQALAYCKNTPVQCNGIFFYENTPNTILFSALKNDTFVCELCRSTIEKLTDTDNEFNHELLLTLSQYISCNYNKNETARKMNLHRQSLLYRLKKIEELTGLSLEDHDSLYLLESCLRLLKIL